VDSEAYGRGVFAAFYQNMAISEKHLDAVKRVLMGKRGWE